MVQWWGNNDTRCEAGDGSVKLSLQWLAAGLASLWGVFRNRTVKAMSSGLSWA